MHLAANISRARSGDGVESILVVRFSSLGDIILTTPVLRALKHRWPGARLTFATKAEFAGLLDGNPHVDELATLPAGGGAPELRALAAELAGRRWDLLADLHGSLRSRILRKLVPARLVTVYRKPLLKRWALIYLRLDLFRGLSQSVPERYAGSLAELGVTLDGGPCELHPPSEARERVESRIAGRWGAEAAYMAVAPGAAWPVKRWPSERFAEAASELADSRDLKVVLLGGKAERTICAQVAKLAGQERCLNLAGELEIMASVATLAGARILLSNDTGLMHAAGAVGTPVVALFGPTTRHFGYFPWRSASRVVEIPLYCRPCTHNGRRRCPLGHFRCMRDISAAQVVRAAEQLLGD